MGSAEGEESADPAVSDDDDVVTRDSSLVDDLADGLVRLGANGEIRAVNETLAELAGRPRKELLGERVSAVFAEPTPEQLYTVGHSLYEADDATTVECSLRTGDGDTVPCDVRLQACADGDEFDGLSGVVRPLDSDTNPAEPEQPADIDQVLDRITDAVFALDEEWQFTYLNDQAGELLESPEGELIGSVVWDEFSEAVDTTFQQQYERAMRTQEVVTFEEYFPPLDTWFTVRAYPSKTGLSVYFRDITDRKEMEAELREREQRFVMLSENLNEVVWMTSPDGEEMLYINSAYEKVWGRERDELYDDAEAFLDGVHPDDRERVRESYQALPEEEFEEIYRIVRPDGTERWMEARGSPVRDTDGEVIRVVGIGEDITERREAELELEAREEHLRETTEIIADKTRTFDEQVEELLEIGRETLDAEYATVSRIRGDQYVFDTVVGPEGGDIDSGDVVPLSSTNCERTISSEETVILENIEDEAPELARREGNQTTDINCYLGTPIFVDGEVIGTFCFYGSSVSGFTEWDETFVDLVGDWLGSRLESRRNTERLAALNELNGVVRGISEAVIEQSTREQIEETVCERLAESESYTFAWLGEPNTATQEIELRAEAGVEGYLDGVTISVAPDDEESQGPTGRAIRTEEVQTAQNVTTDPQYEPWQEQPERYDFQSSAAVPIVHEGTIYGALNVYTERLDAFEGEERDVLEHLGELVGHAIAAVERKRALMGDNLTELEFGAPNFLSGYGHDSMEGTISLEQSIPVGDETFLVYGTADEESVDSLKSIAKALPDWDELTAIDEDLDGTRFEIRLSEPPLLSAVASLGGSVERAVFEDGDFRMTVHVPGGVDVRTVIDAVQDMMPEANALARRQVTKSDAPSERVDRTLSTELTDRQRTALEAAYYAGFFEWPRDSSGEDVAESLDIASPTFHQHARAAENKIFGALFDET
ncbi:MAG: PAS domain S-box-containing protein [Natronomonas sp.]|jgi:PAS domain S-box-containing protein|uniref:PAS domain S-box protein n=1 Tax=Natronomonas sp. TaxID=2184060 RepID=UPI003989E937